MSPSGDLEVTLFFIALPDAGLNVSVSAITATRAQKPQFCARNARKRRSRRPKKHKNPDFVLVRG